ESFTTKAVDATGCRPRSQPPAADRATRRRPTTPMTRRRPRRRAARRASSTAMPQPDPHGVIAFAASLDTRPDRHRVLAALARGFIEHRDQLWPRGDPHATPQWIANNTAAMLRVLERIYRAACDP